MQIEITIANEEKLVAEYRKALHSQARLLVYDHPDRTGKQFAQVTFPPIELRHYYIDGAELEVKVEFV